MKYMKNYFRSAVKYLLRQYEAFMAFHGRIYSSASPDSSKRFYGSIGWAAAIVGILIWKRDLLQELLYTSAALIAGDKIMNTLTTVFNKKKNENTTDNKKDT